MSNNTNNNSSALELLPFKELFIFTGLSKVLPEVKQQANIKISTTRIIDLSITMNYLINYKFKL